MSESVLRVAVIGVGGFGRATVEALAGVDCVELVGVADRNGKAAAQIGQDFGVRSYTDNRSVLAETGPEAVFLAVPPMVAPDLVAECAKRGIHVWRELPLGRNLDEAVSLVRLMDKAKLKFAVGTQRRFASPYRRAWQLRRKLGQTFLGRSHYLFNWGPELGWRSDKTSAGGGALLELGYPAVNLLIWMLGLPEEVYGINSCGYRPAHNDSAPTTTPYDTDD
ncbi:MAG: Gfo/Idh/MocA family protein, partial [Phycisphaerae bacterium]